MPEETVVYYRQRLYEEIWKKPVREVAKSYGVSDTALAKICRKLKVPRPARGYWARINVGLKVEPEPLPALAAGEASEHLVTRWKYPPPPELSDEEKAFRARPEFNPKWVEPPFALTVPATLEKPHTLVAETQKSLRKVRPDPDGLLATGESIPIAVGPSQVDRALRFLDTLIKGVERAGHRVARFESYNKRCRFVVDDIGIAFSMNERLLRSPHVPVKGEFFPRKWDHRPAGDLRFKLEWKGEWDNAQRWDEKPNLRLESQINSVFQSILQIPVSHRAMRAERLARAQLSYEAEQRRRAGEAKRLEEERRADQIVAMAQRWSTSCQIRDFVEAVRARAVEQSGSIEAAGPVERWLSYASSVAERIDPISQLLPK
jgi:hypothetical protein